jgi:transcriptional regulator with XRE-family HTH domain
MNLGKTILELRREKHVKQEELAAELGVTAAAVSKWENGYTLPDVLMLCALADYFQVTTDELLGRNPQPLCAAIVTSSLELGEKIRTLVKQYGVYTKHIIYGSYEDAIEVVKDDNAVTHLFVSLDQPMGEHEKAENAKLRIVESHSENEEKVLEGFEFYLKNMTNFDTIAQKAGERA